MGRSIVRRGGPLLCYNAANHWDLGFYHNGRRDLGTTGPASPIKITLTGFSSYPSGNTFLVKIGNIYMQYNHASAHNINTDKSTSNQLVVVQKGSRSRTSRLAVLDQGNEYRSGAFVVRVCAKQGSSIDISIGRTSTNCGAAATPPPPPPPAPRPAPQPTATWGNSWFQSAPRPTPTAPTWWNPAPTPQPPRPTVTFPPPAVIWFPHPSAIAVFRPTSPSPPFFRPSGISSAPSPSWFSTWTWSSNTGAAPTSTPWTCFFGC